MRRVTRNNKQATSNKRGNYGHWEMGGTGQNIKRKLANRTKRSHSKIKLMRQGHKNNNRWYTRGMKQWQIKYELHTNII